MSHSKIMAVRFLAAHFRGSRRDRTSGSGTSISGACSWLPATFVRADSEFDICITRRGEALSLKHEGPTFGYFPVVYYYQGRPDVRKRLGS